MTTLLTKGQAAQRVSLHPEYVMTLAKQGKFPAPIKFGPSKNTAVRFLESEIEAWIAEKIVTRDAQVAGEGA